MSVNFGYGMNGMNGLTGGMQTSSGTEGNVFQEMKAKYGCEQCYQHGPRPYNYQMQVNPLPYQANYPSFISRIFKRLTGG